MRASAPNPSASLARLIWLAGRWVQAVLINDGDTDALALVMLEVDIPALEGPVETGEPTSPGQHPPTFTVPDGDATAHANLKCVTALQRCSVAALQRCSNNCHAQNSP